MVRESKRSARAGLSVHLSSSAIALAAAFLPGTAFAQDAMAQVEAETAAEEPVADEIIVTGSRIQRDGFSAPTPVTTLSIEQIEQRAPSSIADVLITIPSFRPTSSPSTSGVNSRTGGLIAADLRGLGSQRTLVLVNGRRFVASDTNGVVDLKLIPSLLISQVETVTGGASAAWGSDAVAGVVNFILKDKMDGIEGTIQSGISQQGDNEEFRAALAAGTSFFDGRLNVVIGGDFIDNKGIGNQYTRDWGREEVGLITNTGFATNGLPQYIISPDVRPSLMTPGGLIVSGPLRGIAFGPNGTTSQFQFGQVFGTSMIGGGNEGQNLSNATQLAAPYNSKILMGKVDFEVSPALTLFAEVNAAWTNSSGASQQPRDQGNLTIRVDNAYLPASVRQAMIANGLSTIAVGRLNNDAGQVQIDIENKTFRAVGGAKGDLGGSWSWDAYFQYGRNRNTVVTGPNNRMPGRFALAIDAVVNPATGMIVCRSTLTNPTNGCKPQNIFGDGSVVVDDYSFGTATFNLQVEQRVAALNFAGDLFSTWAGPVSVAFGGEYRKEEAVGTSDPLSQQVQANGSIGAFQIGNQLPINGSYDLLEFYAEAAVPLMRDSALGKSLDLNGAVRRTDYSTSGPVTTWKGGITYEPFEGLRLRGTRSRDIRAPSLAELFQSGGSSFINVFDRVLNQSIQVRDVLQGNTALTPEVADTLTAGFVLTPSFLPRFSLAVDYYDIKIRDAIGSISSSLAVTRCNAGQAEFCNQVVFNPNGTILSTISQSLNLNAFRTSGVDVEARYDFDLGGGNVTLRGLVSYVDRLVTTDASGTFDRVGKLSGFNRINGVPKLTANFDVTYAKDDFSVNLLTRVIGKGQYNPDFTEGVGALNTINDNSVPAYAYLSLSVSQGIDLGNGRKVQLFALVNNLLDTDPALIPSGTIGGANETSTNPAFYDTVGRAFKLGFRFKI